MLCAHVNEDEFFLGTLRGRRLDYESPKMITSTILPAASRGIPCPGSRLAGGSNGGTKYRVVFFSFRLKVSWGARI